MADFDFLEGFDMDGDWGFTSVKEKPSEEQSKQTETVVKQTAEGTAKAVSSDIVNRLESKLDKVLSAINSTKSAVNEKNQTELDIAKKQIEIEDAIPKNSPYLFLDTDLIVCKVWSEFKYNNCHPWILEQIQERYYDYYLLCDIDLPWQNDGMREHPNHRQVLLAIYENELKDLNKSYTLVSGNNRTQMAIDLVKRYA